MKPDSASNRELSEINGLVDQFTNPILWLVTSHSGQRRGGLIATFISKASLVPHMPRFVVGIAHHHFTWRLIEDSHALSLHVVCQDQMHWVDQFGLQSANSGVDKFLGIATHTATTGSPILSDAILWMDCRVESSLNTGDRTFYLVQAVAAGSHRQGEPARLNESLSRLTAEQRDECQCQLACDIQIDAAAIQVWRAESNLSASQ